MSYIGNEPVVSATRTITEVTATAGQTVFNPNGGYTVGKIDVIVNGAELSSDDFTATNGTTVTLTTACTAGDIVKLIAWGTFNTANISSGSLTAGGPLWSQSGGVTLPRIDSSTEGGQLNFNRASDDTATWAIDSYGSNSTPSLRFLDGANVRMSLDSTGNLLVGSVSSPSNAGNVSAAGWVKGGYVIQSSGYENGNYTITTPATVYAFNKDQGAGGGSSSTVFNITGIPNTDGAWALIYVRSSNTVGGVNCTAQVQVNGTQVFSGGVQNTTKTAVFTVFRANGSWMAGAWATGASLNNVW